VAAPVDSPVALCNLALGHVGKSFISALDENSAEAAACALYWPVARQTMLQASLWTFALRRIDLAQIENDFPIAYSHAYAYPVNALRVVRLFPADRFVRRRGRPEPDFEVREGKIYTFEPAVAAEVLVDVEDVTQYPALFVQALSYHLAEFLARVLVRAPALAREMATFRDTALAAAVAADAAQDMKSYLQEPPDDYSDARR